jgi:hypothetical protein
VIKKRKIYILKSLNSSKNMVDTIIAQLNRLFQASFPTSQLEAILEGSKDPEIFVGLSSYDDVESPPEKYLKRRGILSEEYAQVVASAKADIAINVARAAKKGLLAVPEEQVHSNTAEFSYNILIPALQRFAGLREELADAYAQTNKDFLPRVIEYKDLYNLPWTPVRIKKTPTLSVELLMALRKNEHVAVRARGEAGKCLDNELVQYYNLLNILDTFHSKSADNELLDEVSRAQKSLMSYLEGGKLDYESLTLLSQQDQRYRGFVRRERFNQILLDSNERYWIVNFDIRQLAAYNKAAMENAFIQLSEVFNEQLLDSSKPITKEQTYLADQVIASVLRPVDSMMSDIYRYIRSSLMSHTGNPEDVILTAAGDEVLAAVRMPLKVFDNILMEEDDRLEDMQKCPDAWEVEWDRASIFRNSEMEKFYCKLGEIDKGVINAGFSDNRECLYGIIPSVRIAATTYDGREGSFTNTRPLINAIIRTDKGIRYLHRKEQAEIRPGPVIVEPEQWGTFFEDAIYNKTGVTAPSSPKDYFTTLWKLPDETTRQTYMISVLDDLLNRPTLNGDEEILKSIVKKLVNVPGQGNLLPGKSYVGRTKVSGPWRKELNMIHGNESVNILLDHIMYKTSEVLKSLPDSYDVQTTYSRGGDTYFCIFNGK